MAFEVLGMLEVFGVFRMSGRLAGPGCLGCLGCLSFSASGASGILLGYGVSGVSGVSRGDGGHETSGAYS